MPSFSVEREQVVFHCESTTSRMMRRSSQRIQVRAELFFPFPRSAWWRPRPAGVGKLVVAERPLGRRPQLSFRCRLRVALARNCVCSIDRDAALAGKTFPRVRARFLGDAETYRAGLFSQRGAGESRRSFALLVIHVVVFEKVFARVEVCASTVFCAFSMRREINPDSMGTPSSCPGGTSAPSHAAAKDAHQVVFK